MQKFVHIICLNCKKDFDIWATWIALRGCYEVFAYKCPHCKQQDTIELLPRSNKHRSKF